MSDHTPSLDEIRTDYAQLTARHRGSFFGNRAEFDRAIAKIRTDAKAEALREASIHMRDNWPLHPLRPSEAKHVEGWLRARADNLEAPNAS